MTDSEAQRSEQPRPPDDRTEQTTDYIIVRVKDEGDAAFRKVRQAIHDAAKEYGLAVATVPLKNDRTSRSLYGAVELLFDRARRYTTKLAK